MNLASSPMLMWTVPSSRGSMPISLRDGLEEGVLLHALGGDDVQQRGDDALAFAGDLGLDERAVQQVAAVLGRRAAHVVAGPAGDQPHRDQPRVGVGEQPSHVAEVGDDGAVQVPVGGVGDGLVEGVGTHADRAPAQVVLADVDRVERGVEGAHPAVQQVGLGDRVLVQRVIRHVVLRIHHVLLAVVPIVLGVGGEEDVLVGISRDPRSCRRSTPSGRRWRCRCSTSRRWRSSRARTA